MNPWKTFSLRETLQKFSTSRHLHLEHGVKKEKLNVLEQKEKDHTEDIMLENFLEKNLSPKVKSPEKKLSMPESPPKNNPIQEIFNVKSNSSQKNILIMNLSQTLEAELTSREKDFQPFWTTQSGRNSKKLWLPTKTDCVGSDSTLSKSFLENFPMQKSWFSTKVIVPLTENWQETYFRSLPSSLPKLTEEKDIKDPPLTMMKIRLLPTDEEKKTLKRWFGMSRYVYNNSLISLKVLTDKNPLNGFYEKSEDPVIPICPYEFKSGNKKGQKCGKPCFDYFCISHSKAPKNNTCPYESKKGKKCGRKCIRKFCPSHTKNFKKKFNFKLSPISLRIFVEKVRINDHSEFIVDTSEKRQEILKRFVETMDDPKYFYDECKEEKIWHPKWCHEFPTRMFRGMINLLTQDINSSISNENYKLNMRLKTKKDKNCIINSESWNANIPFPSELQNLNGFYRVGTKKIQLKEIIELIRNSSEERNYQISKDEDNKYYLSLPVSPKFFSDFKKNVKGIGDCEIQAQPNRFDICSLDPGVRTFMTLYGLDHVVEIGKNDCLKIFDMLELGDSYQSKISLGYNKKMNKKRRRKNKKRIKNLVDELHRKTVSFLTSNYKTILLPEFKVSKMVKGNNLSAKTKRQMLAFRFYMFKQRLIDKCSKKGVDLRIISEAYTTKCCSECGVLTDVGGSKIFKCSNEKCPMFHIELDRDVNAARNILIRYVFS